MMLLDWGGKPEYKSWDNAPKFRTLKLSELIDRKDEIMKSKMYLKVHLDINISYEEANFLKETFMSEHDIRELSLIQEKNNIEGVVEDNPDASFESVDQIVHDQLVNIDSDAFDKKLLLDIYSNL
jgi:hypothetical protein